jgi:hypothetical protein
MQCISSPARREATLCSCNLPLLATGNHQPGGPDHGVPTPSKFS